MNLKKVERLESNIVEMEISVEREEFDDACNQAYRKRSGGITVPGFRKGKAPRKMIEKMYGEGFFYEDAINISYPAAYDEAVEKAGIEPVDKADFEVLDVSSDGYAFTVKVTVSPEVKIGQYKGLTAFKPEVTVTDDEVTAKLDELLKKSARIQAASRPAALGDTVDIDFEGFLDGEAFAGGKAENFALKLGSNQFIPGFEDQLVGIMANENREVKVTFPTEYHQESLSGKETVFKVLCHEVKEEILPEADDEFAKDVSEYDTLDELKESIRSNILSLHEEEANKVFENNLIDELLKTFEAEIPEVMIKNKANEIVNNIAYEMSMRGVTMEGFLKASGKTADEVVEESMEPAQRQVKIALALEKVAELENFTVTDQDIVAAQAEFAGRMRVPEDMVKTYYPEHLVRKDLKTGKALEIIRDNAISGTEPVSEAKENESSDE